MLGADLVDLMDTKPKSCVSMCGDGVVLIKAFLNFMRVDISVLQLTPPRTSSLLV